MSLRPTVLSPASLLRRSIDRHLREVHGLSRRTFLQSAASTAGLALTASLGMPKLAQAKDHDRDHDIQPKPIPGERLVLGIPIHHFPVQSTDTPISALTEPSQITDFNGLVGLNRIRGAGSHGFDQLAFQADMGFMKGKYIGEDGKSHDGVFAFI